MLKFLLLPLALVAAAMTAMVVEIVGSTLHHRLAWSQTLATVDHAEQLCALTYQPGDQLLRRTATVDRCDRIGKARLPADATRPRIQDGLYGRLVYSAGGAERSFEGKLSDAGVYAASAGMTIPLLYDPADPGRLASGAMKGWFGALLIFLCSSGFAAFYTWFFWLRRR